MKYLSLMRVHHWIKNSLIYAALFFGNKLLDKNAFWECTIVFFAFSLITSCVYIMNDICDIENDRRHYKKCKRVLASGKVKLWQAYIIGAICFTVAMGILIFNTKNYTIYMIVAMYLLINIFYSKLGKHIAIVDIFLLSACYILRMFLGGVVVGVHISGWLYLTVIFMAFYLSFGKRRNEIHKNGDSSRGVLKKYNYTFLDKWMNVCLTLTIMCYAMWCEHINTLKNNFAILGTVPIVLFICMKYGLCVEQENSDADPMSVILENKVLLFLSVGYVVLMFVLLYAF